jgi:hypothetical protein
MQFAVVVGLMAVGYLCTRILRFTAAITLTVWKKGERFDPMKLSLQVA